MAQSEQQAGREKAPQAPVARMSGAANATSFVDNRPTTVMHQAIQAMADRHVGRQALPLSNDDVTRGDARALVSPRVMPNPVIQGAWIETSKPNELMWHELRSGLRWYYNVATRAMHFDDEGSGVQGLADEGHKPKSYRAWVEEWRKRRWISDDKAEGLSFSDYAQHIVETYPIDQYHYVGIGASCDLVLSYMKEKYGLVFNSIPISGVTNIKSTDRRDWETHENENVLKYVAAYLPHGVLADGKKLLLMDVASGGNTLIVIGDVVRELVFKAGGDSNKVTTFSLNATLTPTANVQGRTDGRPYTGEVPSDQTAPRALTPDEKRIGMVKGNLDALLVVDFDDEYVPDEEDSDLDNDKKDGDRKDGDKGEKIDLFKTSGDETSDDEEEAPEKFVALPITYDRMISDVNGKGSKDVEARLLNQDYKDLGRRREKVDINKEVMTGKLSAEQEKLRKGPENTIDDKVRDLLRHGPTD